MCLLCGRNEIRTEFQLGNLKESDHLEDLDIVLNWMLQKQGLRALTGLIWLRGKQRAFTKVGIIFFGNAAPSGPRPPHSRGFQITPNDTQESGGLLDKVSALSQRLLPDNTHTYNRKTSTHPVRFGPTVSADEGPQTYALVRTATGTGS